MKILIRITVISMSFLLGFCGALFAQNASSSCNDDRFKLNGVNLSVKSVNDSLTKKWLQASAHVNNTCSCPPNTQEKIMRTGGQTVAYCEICDAEKCNCGTKLNTSIPFIGRCIMYKKTNNTNQWWTDTVSINALNAFPVLMGSLMKILMSLILLVAFGSLIVAGVMMTVPDQYESGKKLIWKVVYAIALLWLSGTILYLINPNFFK